MKVEAGIKAVLIIEILFLPSFSSRKEVMRNHLNSSSLDFKI